MGGEKKILIVDDHMVVIEGIQKALTREAGFQVVGVANDGLKAIAMVKTLRPDIVIMDISMPQLDGIASTREIKRWNNNVDIVIFTMHTEEHYIAALVRMGISGYVLKGDSMACLMLALKAIRLNGVFFSRTVMERLRGHLSELSLGIGNTFDDMRNSISRLGKREKEVFLLLADGMTPRQIADRLSISSKTVETHKYNIFEKLKVTSTAQLVKIAMKKNLIGF
jgi:DNA-binding NarL/FixJ family response regulator